MYMSLILGKEYGGIYEGWELIADIPIIVDSTTVTISGLDGDKDEVYLLTFRGKNNSSLGVGIYLYPNGITTNMSTQLIHVDGTGIGASLESTPLIGGASAGLQYFSCVVIYAKTGKQRRWVTHYVYQTTIMMILASSLWNETVTNITFLDLESENPSGIGKGSHILLFKKKG